MVWYIQDRVEKTKYGELSMVDSLPSWYRAEDCGVLRLPNLDRAAESGAEFARTTNLGKCQRWQNVSPSIVLSVIDCQIDFTNPEGALFVPGAVEDTDRLNRFIYKNVGLISHVLGSLDSHYIFQPFHRFNWIAGSKPTSRPDGRPYQSGEHPDPFTIITLQDVRDGVWMPLRFPQKMQEYLQKLERDAKKQLCIWPVHCVLGTPGHAWDPSFSEALVYHAAARNNQYDATTKGMSQLSEHYGILQAEVQFAEDPNTQLNTRVLTKWEQADAVYFAGQAKSHCCLATLEQVVAVFQGQQKNHLLEKLFVLRDCMSSVGDIDLPDGTKIEFDRMTNERFAEMEQLGVKFVDSTDDIKV
ncbi:MAG: hypothetical protein ACXAC5_01725 [Promethearchaeota archaeon]|jgi:nicotinamidase-related amidase